MENQAEQLDVLGKEIEEKKVLANRYAILAKTNQEAFAAFRAEMEDAVRTELLSQAEKGKRIRRVLTFIFWLITLILGAALGAYLKYLLKTSSVASRPNKHMHRSRASGFRMIQPAQRARPGDVGR